MPLFASSGPSGDDVEDPNKRAKLMLLVLGVVVVLAAVFWFAIKPMLSKSDSSASDTPTPVTTGSAAPAPVPSATKATPTPSPQASFAVNDSTRDPFAQLAIQVQAVQSAQPTAAPLPSVTADPNPTPSPTATSTSAPSSSPSPSSQGAHTLTLLSVTGNSATITVDGADTNAQVGATLAAGVSLVKVTSDAVFVTYQSKAYAIAIGQTVTV